VKIALRRFEVGVIERRGLIGCGLGIARREIKLSRSSNRGIAALQAAIERISGSRDFTLRAPVLGNDELARTAAAFNEAPAR